LQGGELAGDLGWLDKDKGWRGDCGQIFGSGGIGSDQIDRGEVLIHKEPTARWCGQELSCEIVSRAKL